MMSRFVGLRRIVARKVADCIRQANRSTAERIGLAMQSSLARRRGALESGTGAPLAFGRNMNGRDEQLLAAIWHRAKCNRHLGRTAGANRPIIRRSRHGVAGCNLYCRDGAAVRQVGPQVLVFGFRGDVEAFLTMAKRSLLIVNTAQFGYHTGTYYYCRYLREEFRITYFCWDYGRPRIELDGITVKYVSRNGPKLIRYLRWLGLVTKECGGPYDLVFLDYFAGCSVVRARRPARNVIFDIRTGSVSSSRVRRVIEDRILRVEARHFRNVTVISESLAERLGFLQSRVHILPLGADLVSTTEKSFREMRLLYVGTLEDRRIEDTIVGLRQYLDGPGEHPISAYTIVGSGPSREEGRLRALIQTCGLQSLVCLAGRVPHEKLGPYLDSHNIGVSYIPITEYFDCQPPTKTFEYLLSGMAVIATATRENKRLVNDTRGVLVCDSSTEFAKGLHDMERRLAGFSSDRIRDGVREFTWQAIIEKNLVPFLDGLGGANAYDDGAFKGLH